MARMKFLCDAERCIECNGCVTACKQEHDVPWGVNRRRVVTINDGVPGERSISVACMHCSDAPCMAVCPVDCFYKTTEGVVLHDKDLCIGCGYCFYACPFGAPQFPQTGAFGVRGKMDKCTFCAGGPEPDGSPEEFAKYGRNRLSEGKLPACAEMCSTKALLAGDADVLSGHLSRSRHHPRRARHAGRTAVGLGHRVRRGGQDRGAAAAGATTAAGRTGAEVMSRLAVVGVALAATFALAACGERPQVVDYKQGKYAGKPDTPAVPERPVQRRPGGLGARARDARPGAERVPADQIGVAMRQVFGARVAGALLFAFCAAVAGGALAQQIPTPVADAGKHRIGAAGAAPGRAAAEQRAGVARGPLGRSRR